jgi:hypothetical protein
MKDDLTALMEAVRLVSAEIDARGRDRAGNAVRILDRIDAILVDTGAREALAHLYVDAPGIVPADSEHEPA